MTITRADLKIFKPEQLGSSDDAGGQRTKNVVESGKLNEVFRAISDIDHAQSAVDIVKVYPALDTVDTSILLDGHIFISQKPTDPLVSLLIAESDVLSDADRMTDMVEILESSVRAGELIRRNLIGLLAGQDTFPRPYLQSVYQFNGKDFYENVTLMQGQTIVISVEYPGAENELYPRFEHFCQIEKTVTGGTGGQVFFKPAMPFNTPDPNVVLGGEQGCTKLRYTSNNDGIKYHGVTKLTTLSTTEILNVESTISELLPTLKSVAFLPGNTISTGTGAEATQAVRKGVFTERLTGRSSYSIYVTDFLHDQAWFANRGLKPAIAAGFRPYNSTLSVVLSNSPLQTITITNRDAGSVIGETGSIGFEYYSTNDYAIYTSTVAFPASKQLVGGTVKGSVRFTVNTQHPNATFTMTAQGNCIDDVDSRVWGNININTGVFTKAAEDFRGEFELVSYSGFVEASTGSAPVGVYTTQFMLKSSAPVIDSFYVTIRTVDNVLLSGSCNALGVVTGSGVSGTITDGLVELTFTQGCMLDTLRYDINETVTLSPPPELYGLNPLRIKNGGVVDAFTAWNTVSVQDTQVQVVASPAPAQTINARADARFVDITDANGKSLWTLANAHYTWVKATGVITINSDFAGFTAPFVLTDTIGEIALVTEVKPNQLTLASPLSRSYPIGSNVSSVQNLGDLQARIGTVRDMTSWSNNWEIDGTNTTASLNVVDFPIEVRNDTAINEDWVLIFTSPTAFRCVGKRLGQIATGDTLNDFAPINPLTLAPYFIIRSGAFGGGWAQGEAIRFRSYASSKPAMLLRTVQSGHSQITTDRAVLAFRGNES